MIRINSDEETGASLSMADLTPLIDVVFIVLVFLMFTANVPTLSLPVNLPTATEQATVTSEPKTLTVSIMEKGKPWAIEDQRYDHWDTFSQKLIQQVKAQPETTVLIAGDEAAPLGNLVKLMAFLSEHKIDAAQVLLEEGAPKK